MPVRVFYSWQSDRSQNRNFIRTALNSAAVELQEKLALDEPQREIVIDQDTQGLPGSPGIAEAILTKIRSTDIFVADLTFIDDTASASASTRRTPNPNVMLEYGYALHALSDARIIGVFNEQFGLPQELPFDLAHRRWPIRFSLQDGIDRQAEKKRLISALKEAIRSITSQFEQHDQGAASPSPLPFPAAPAGDGVGRLRSESDFLCVAEYTDTADQTIVLPKGPYMFLRLTPTRAIATMGDVETYRIAQASLQPMQGMRTRGWNTGRHQTGTVVYSSIPESSNVAVDASELFMSGELWGNEFHLLNPAKERVKEHGFPYFPTGAIEEVLIDTFINFTNVAREHVHVNLPVEIKAGFAGVRDFRLAVKPEYFGYSQFAGRILRDTVIHESLLNDWSVDPFDFLRPLFEKMYDAAGIARPNFRTAGRRQR
jgi:hypothetical protein